MSESSIKTLTAESEEILDNFANEYSFDRSTERGVRKVPRGALRNSSDDASFFEEIYMPVNLDSIEALRFIGLKKDAAETILTNFHNRPDRTIPASRDDIYDMFGFIEGYLAHKDDAWDEDDEEWDALLRAMGIRKSTRDGILNPKFKSLRLSQTARFWVLETLEDGWDVLMSADQAVRGRRGHFRERAERRYRGRARQEESFEEEAGKRGTPILESRTLTPMDLADSNTFYKGGAKIRLNRAYGEATDEGLMMESLLSTPPGDFSRDRRILYLTPQRQVAYQYAEFSSSRFPEAAHGILHLAVAKDFLPAPQQLVGNDWADLVWVCRGPGHLTMGKEDRVTRARFANSTILVGACCCVNEKVIGRLENKENVPQMKLSNGESAEQWAFFEEELRTNIGVHCKDRVWWEETHQKSKDKSKSFEG